MIGNVKEKIAEFIVNKKLKQFASEKQSFKDLLKSSFNFFIIMPENENHFHHAMKVIKFLETLNKNLAVFTHDYRVNLLPQKYHAQAVDFGIADINKLNLPSKRLEEKLKALEYQAVIDLNKEDNLFNSFSANLVRSPVRIGFQKNNSDKFYNLQIVNKEDNPEIFYKNLLNCLQMF